MPHSFRLLVSLVTVALLAVIAAAQTSSEVLLVTLRAGDVLLIVDPAAGKVVGRVPTGDEPHGVTASADGRLAFVANINEDTISVIDIAARKEVRRLRVPGTSPHDLQFAGGKLYFTAEGYKAIGRYDPATQRLDYFGLGQENPHMVAVNRDGTKVFAANRYSQTVSVIDVLKGPPEWNVTTIPVGRSGEGIDLAPNGREIWTGNRDHGGVSVIDLATKQVTHIDTQTEEAVRLRVTPDGRHVIVSDNPGESRMTTGGQTVVVDTASRKVIKRIAGTSGSLLVTPDGGRAYLATGRTYVAVLDLKSLEVVGKIETGPDTHEVAWAQTR